jgi:hypothetical protein
MLQRAPSAKNLKRERQRRWLARRQRDQAMVSVVVSHNILNALIDLGWLTAEATADRAKVGAAITAMLTDLGANPPQKVRRVS